MKKTLWRPLLAAVLCLGAGRSHQYLAATPEVVPTPPALPLEEPFADVSFGQRWYDGAQYGYRNGLVRGMTERSFAGELPATRAMAVTMLWRLAGEPEVLGPSGFSDVEPESWYTPAAVWAETRDILLGYGDNTLRPDESVTWDQLELIFARYYGEGKPVGAAISRPLSQGPGRREEQEGPLTRGELAETFMELREEREK